MFRLFKFPQDLWWVISQSLSTSSIIFSCIDFNLIAFLISISVFLCFALLWFKFIFWPWYRIKKSYRMLYKNIKICYHRDLTNEERTVIQTDIDEIENRTKLFLKISPSCIDSSFNDVIVVAVDDINEKYYNAKYGTSFKRISGLAQGKLIIVDISNGFSNSALKHELCHVIFDICLPPLSEAEQHATMSRIGV